VEQVYYTVCISRNGQTNWSGDAVFNDYEEATAAAADYNQKGYWTKIVTGGPPDDDDA
jgi:hypothetical protein